VAEKPDDSAPNQPEDEPKRSKADGATVKQRVNQVLRFRLEGRSFQEIVHFSSLNGWCVGERQLKKYIRKADELLTEQQDRKRKNLIARHIARREMLFSVAFSVSENPNDFRACAAILDSSAKLHGLFPDPRDIKEIVKLVEAQQAKIAELERRQDNADRKAEGNPAQAEPNPATPGPDDTRAAGGAAEVVPG
jgi:hypothetical protein